ncbi:MAG: hypothetical protein HYS23_06365 [Geobacter sp.]|nr:hypothetical protein [Geobacter sp.]
MSEQPRERWSIGEWYRKGKKALGIDRAVGFTILSRAWGFISFPLTLYLITTFFSKEVQGLYYTFASLLFLQNILELGFGTVMLQFVSHEWAHLRFASTGDVEGDELAAGRLGSLLRLALRWYAGMSLIFFVTVGIFGHFFLGQHKTGIDYIAPWWLLCATVSLSFLLLPLRGVLEGSNQVARSQKINLLATILSSSAGWLSIYSGGKLYTLAVTNGMQLLVGCLLVVPACRPFFQLMRLSYGAVDFSWRREFWPQQWRIGTSWMCGFIMYQTFVPFIFQFHGAVAAGKMGATLQIYNNVNTFSQSWNYAAAPQMGIFSARRDFKSLRDLVKKTYLRSSVVCGILSVMAIVTIILMRYLKMPQADRFSDVYSTGLFLATLTLLQITAVQTQAVRFQKKEPFIVISVTCAVLSIISNYVLGKFFGLTGMIAGFSAIMILYQIPACYYVYKKHVTI